MNTNEQVLKPPVFRWFLHVYPTECVILCCAINIFDINYAHHNLTALMVHLFICVLYTKAIRPKGLRARGAITIVWLTFLFQNYELNRLIIHNHSYVPDCGIVNQWIKLTRQCNEYYYGLNIGHLSQADAVTIKKIYHKDEPLLSFIPSS